MYYDIHTRQDVNYKLLVLRVPHFHLCIRANERLDIALNILHLSAYVFQGDRIERQRPEDATDVDLRSTSD